MPGGLPGAVERPGHDVGTRRFCPSSHAFAPAVEAAARTAIELRPRRPARGVSEMAHGNVVPQRAKEKERRDDGARSRLNRTLFFPLPL